MQDPCRLLKPYNICSVSYSSNYNYLNVSSASCNSVTCAQRGKDYTHLYSNLNLPIYRLAIPLDYNELP